MTDKLPILSGKEVVKALGKLGYSINDQKGSHIQSQASGPETADRFQPPGSCPRDTPDHHQGCGYYR
jgi:hypothetical protein